MTEKLVIENGPSQRSFCCIHTCDNDAEWVIETESTDLRPAQSDSYTHACTDHVGALLCDGHVHTVYPID